MPLSGQLHSPEHIIKAEVLLVALAKGLALDAPGKRPLPSGHTLRLQVGQLLCSAVWDAAKHVWCTSSILYGGVHMRQGDVARPLICLLEPAELHAVLAMAPGASPGAGPMPTALATLKVLVQNVPLLAFVEPGSTPPTQTVAGISSAAAVLAPGAATTSAAAMGTGQQGGLQQPPAGAAGMPGSSGLHGQAAGTSSAQTPGAGPSGASFAAQQPEAPAGPGQQGGAAEAPGAEPGAPKQPSEWRLRVCYSSLELPTRMVSNVAFVTEDYVPVQVLVVELEVDLARLVSLLPGALGRNPGETGGLQAIVTLELCLHNTCLCSLAMPAVVAIPPPQLLAVSSVPRPPSGFHDGSSPFGYDAAAAAAASMHGGQTLMADSRAAGSSVRQYRHGGTSASESLAVSESAMSGESSFVTVASSVASEVLPSSLVGMFMANRPSAPDAATRYKPHTFAISGTQSISSRDEVTGVPEPPVVRLVPPVQPNAQQVPAVSAPDLAAIAQVGPRRRLMSMAAAEGAPPAYEPRTMHATWSTLPDTAVDPRGGQRPGELLPPQQLQQQPQVAPAAAAPADREREAGPAHAVAHPRGRGGHGAPSPTGAGPGSSAEPGVRQWPPTTHIRLLNALDSAECSEYQTALSSMEAR